MSLTRKVKILIAFGTRPEAVKMAPVLLRLQKELDFDVRVCITGQHREMLNQVLELFNIVPDHDLSVMTPDQDLYDLTTRILTRIKKVLSEELPDLVLVQGDTTTAFSVALGALYAHVSVGHIEAGLRTGNLNAPFPEEANRSLISKLATLHFAPTARARDNLLREGIAQDHIWVTGNTVVDALLWTREQLGQVDVARWKDAYGSAWYVIQQGGPLVLITGHRRESFGQGFRDICAALRQVAQEHPDWSFVYPVHLNPNVQNPVRQILGDLSNFHLLEPLEYAPFVYLMDKSSLILTDSGGIQEEAPSFGKTVLVMREVTERPEGIEAGCAKLVGTDVATIVTETNRAMRGLTSREQFSQPMNPYGDGHAADRITAILKRSFVEPPASSESTF